MAPTLLAEPLAPSCPDFPEKVYRQATIVCEGPGACEASPLELAQALLDGPVIAVNRAIALSDRIPIDFWAMMDEPKMLWDWGIEQAHASVKFLSGDDYPNIWLWRELLGEDCGGRLYVRSPTYMEALAEVSVDGAAPMMPTLFHVFAWLLQVGVKDVRLIGCDMRGQGSPLSPEWSPIEDEAHQLRWGIERFMVARSIKEYRKRGARLKRWHP